MVVEALFPLKAVRRHGRGGHDNASYVRGWCVWQYLARSNIRYINDRRCLSANEQTAFRVSTEIAGPFRSGDCITAFSKALGKTPCESIHGSKTVMSEVPLRSRLTQKLSRLISKQWRRPMQRRRAPRDKPPHWALARKIRSLSSSCQHNYMSRKPFLRSEPAWSVAKQVAKKVPRYTYRSGERRQRCVIANY